MSYQWGPYGLILNVFHQISAEQWPKGQVTERLFAKVPGAVYFIQHSSPSLLIAQTSISGWCDTSANVCPCAAEPNSIITGTRVSLLISAAMSGHKTCPSYLSLDSGCIKMQYILQYPVVESYTSFSKKKRKFSQGRDKTKTWSPRFMTFMTNWANTHNFTSSW